MSFFSKIRDGLKKTATAVGRSIGSLFTDVKTWDASTFEKLKRTLLEADLGPVAAEQITEDIRRRYQIGEIKSAEDVREVGAASIAKLLEQDARPLRMAESGPTVILFVGVNGSGKTTSIGKLACRWTGEGRKVMLAACDTFRAAAGEQLKLWADRSGAQVILSKTGADPASVAFDAVKSALARGVDILLIDTAGRQQNRKALMDELSKMRRTIQKLLPDAPHETILTIDASLGLNALSQAREFADAAGASALLLTKLDGTGKGGAACAVQMEFKLPILFTGLGEAPEDLQDFSAQDYARAFFSGD